jgi:cytochrome c55X
MAVAPSMRSPLWLHLAVLLAIVLLAAFGHAAEPDGRRAAELVRLVRQDCGSCHGMRLTGGLGPALTPAALHDKPAESLKLTITQGRPGTPMPGWSRFLSDEEAHWIVARLREGFPPDENDHAPSAE